MSPGFDVGLQTCDGAHDSEHRGAASHVVLHFFHAVGGLDGDAAGVKGDRLAYQSNHGGAGFRVRWYVRDNDHARRFNAALGDAEQGAHLQPGDFLLVQDFHGQPGFLSHGIGFFGKNFGRQLIGRLVDKVAREILRITDDAAASNSLFTSCFFGVAEASDCKSFDKFVIFLVGFVLVSFEIGDNGALGNGLGHIFGRIAFADEEDNLVSGASLQIAQACASNFTQRGRVKLLALPCPDEEQARGFEAGGRMQQGGFERFASELAAFGEAREHSAGELIEFRGAPLGQVAILENVGNQRIGFQCGKRLGIE
jgi:hypothetical protein